MAFMVWWLLWQCKAQSPGSSATNSSARICLLQYLWSLPAILRLVDPAAIGTCNLKFMAMHMNRMVCHRQVTYTNTHTVISAHYQWVYPGKTRLLKVHKFEIKHSVSLGLVTAGFNIIGVEQKHKSLSTGMNFWSLKCVIQLPISPLPSASFHLHADGT